MSGEKHISSIDLLEDCLGLVHNVRSNVLKTRDRQYKEVMAKKKQQAKLLSRQRVVIERDEDRNNYNEEDQQEQIMDKYAHSYKPSNSNSNSNSNSGVHMSSGVIKRENSNLSSNSNSNTNSNTNTIVSSRSTSRDNTESNNNNIDTDTIMNMNTNVKSPLSSPKNNANKMSPGGGHGSGVQGGSPLFKTTTKYVDSTDVNLQTDQKSIKLLNEFKIELHTWKTKNTIKISDENARSEICDYLIDKYMCQQLDSYISSKVVTRNKLLILLKCLYLMGF